MKPAHLAAFTILVGGLAFAGGDVEVGRFRLHFAGGNAPDLDAMIAMFEAAERDLTPMFGEGAPDLVEVTVSRSAREWEDDTGVDSWAAGMVDGKNEIFVKVPPNKSGRADLQVTVKHEAIHAMLGRSFSRNAPRWLVEGVATYYSSGSKGGFLALADFEDDDAIHRALLGKDPVRRRAAYYASAEKVAQMVRECGGPAVLTWLKALRSDAKAIPGGAGSPCGFAARVPEASVAKAAPPVPKRTPALARLSWSRIDAPAQAVDATKRDVRSLALDTPAPRCGQWSYEGPVIVSIVVDEKGDVVAISPEGIDDCNQQVAAVLPAWRFKPLVIDGRPVAWTRNLTFRFEDGSTFRLRWE